MNSSYKVSLYNIKSKYILKKIFDNLKGNILLKIVKNNKKLKKNLEININDYKNHTKIILEIIPSQNFGKFINIIEEYKPYYHVYFNDSKKGIKAEYINKKLIIKKIKVILDYEIKSLSHLFEECNSIEKINFIQFYRDNIIDMSYMFYKCSSLIELNLKNFNTDNVTNMSFMLSGCKNLTSIDLSKFNTKKLSNMTEMFSFCKNLNSIDISNFDFNNEINKPYILLNCFNLKKVIVNKKFEDIEKKINDKNYIKSNYYLTNSINFKFESSKYYFGRYFEHIIVELNSCKFEPGFQIISLIDNTLIGVLEGPINTSYENGFFFFEIKYNSEYPVRHPRFEFLTKIFHPNINGWGLISKYFYDWTPILRTRTFILSVQTFLGTPFDYEYLNIEAAKLYKENRNLYEDTVKEYVKKYANYSIYKKKLKEYEAEDAFQIKEN